MQDADDVDMGFFDAEIDAAITIGQGAQIGVEFASRHAWKPAFCNGANFQIDIQNEPGRRIGISLGDVSVDGSKISACRAGEDRLTAFNRHVCRELYRAAALLRSR